ncbi:hypothetical protein [Vibrio echinoideorum]|uniref:Oligosaccharide repeat unit polymerase n=1 Tax=Vibrio echinoideorum TaxID=2100116 RepID=A0ABU9FT20_9VIBR
MIFIVCLVVCLSFFGIVNLAFRKLKLNLVGKGAHPIGLFIILQIFIFSFPGVIAVSFLSYDSFRYEVIEDIKKFEIGIWYLYSIIVILFFLFLFIYFFKVKSFKPKLGIIDKHFDYVLLSKVMVLLALAFLILKIYFQGETPLLLLFKGQPVEAYLLRVEMQRNSSSIRVPYIDTFIELLFVYQFLFVVYLSFIGVRLKFLLKGISFFIALYALTYDLQKAPFAILLLVVSFMALSIRGNFSQFLRLLFLVAITLFGFYFFIMDMDTTIILERILERAFLAQNQGFYHIINSIEPNEKYLFHGFYMINKFGVYPERADVDIIPLIYGSNTDIVNSNSYFLGQAWSMFGYWGLVFSPIIVSISVFAYIKLFDVLIASFPVVFIPYAFYILPSMQLNQSLSYFLWGRQFVLDFISIAVVYFFVLFLYYSVRLCKRVN